MWFTKDDNWPMYSWYDRLFIHSLIFMADFGWRLSRLGFSLGHRMSEKSYKLRQRYYPSTS